MQLASSIIAKMMAQLPQQTDDIICDNPKVTKFTIATEDQSPNKTFVSVLPPRSSLQAQEMQQNTPQHGYMRALPPMITVRECMAIIQPEFPIKATLHQLLAFCDSNIFSVNAFDESFPSPVPYICDAVIYRLRLAHHCLRIQSQRYKEAITKLIERKRTREESLKLLQADFSLRQHGDAHQLHRSITSISKEIIFIYLQSNCKLARLRRIMLRSLADVNCRAVTLIALYKLMSSTEVNHYDIPTGDLLPAPGDMQRSVSDEYTYCFDVDNTVDDIATTTYLRTLYNKAYSSLKHRYLSLQQSEQTLMRLDNILSLRLAFVLMRYNYQSHICLMFADEYSKLSLYKRVLQYLRKIASPSAKLLRVANQVVGLTHKYMIKAISEKRNFWENQVFPFLPAYNFSRLSEFIQNLPKISETTYSNVHMTPYPTCLNALSAITPDEGDDDYSIDSKRRTTNLFERIVVQDRSFDAFTSLSSCGTANSSFDTCSSNITHKAFYSVCSQRNQDLIMPNKITTRCNTKIVTKDSYLSAFLANMKVDFLSGRLNNTILTSTQVKKLFDATILIRNRLYKGQTLFYGASCAPNLNSSKVSTLVKYQTFDVDSFSTTNNINEYTLLEATELFSLAFVQVRALLAMRLVLHRNLLCSFYNKYLGLRSFSTFMLRKFHRCTCLQKTSESRMVDELSIRFRLRTVFHIMRRQIDREGQEWDDRSDKLFKFIIMRRQLKHWMTLVQHRRFRLEKMSYILHEIERRIYLRPALIAMRDLYAYKLAEAEISRRFNKLQNVNLLMQAFNTLYHQYKLKRTLRRVMSQALPRWKELLEEEKCRSHTYRAETLLTIFSSWKELTFGGSFIKTAGFTDAPKAIKVPNKALHFEGWSDTDSDVDLSEGLLDSHSKVQFTSDTRAYDGNINNYTDMDKTLHFDLDDSGDEEHDDSVTMRKAEDLTLEDIGEDYWSIYSPQTATELREAYRQVVPQLAKIQQQEERLNGVAEPLPTHHIEVLSKDNLAQLRGEVARRCDRLEHNSRMTANEPTMIDGPERDKGIGACCTQVITKIDHIVEQQRQQQKKSYKKTIHFADNSQQDDTVYRELEVKQIYSKNDISLTIDHHYTNNPTLRQATVWYRRLSCHICISYWRQHFMEVQLAKKYYHSFPGKRLLARVFDEWATKAEMLATRHRRINRLHVYLLLETCFLEWRYHAYIRRERAKQLQAEQTRKEALLLVEKIDKEGSIIASTQPNLKFPGLDSFVGQSKIIDSHKHHTEQQDANRALTLKRIADEHYLFKISTWIANRGILASRERLLRAKLLAAEFSVPDSIIFQIPAKLNAWYLQEGFHALCEVYKRRLTKIS